MRKSQVAIVASLAFVVALTGSVAASPARGAKARVTAIDYPGAANTVAMGINSRGDIVGYYFSVAAMNHAFFLGKNGFVSFDFPGACRTDAWAINAAGDIVGSYNDQPLPGKACATGVQHGYLLRHGHFTSIDVPGATFTGAYGINAEGDIVGHFGVAPTGRMNGFLLHHGTFTTYANPLAEAANMMTCGMGIDQEGEIVGHYQDAGGIHGFILEDGTEFTTIDSPAGYNVQAYGINPRGEIVGFFTDGQTNMIRGFILDEEGGFTPIDIPGALHTYVRKNNPRGDLVGNYTDTSKKQHGFLISARREE